MELAYEAAEWDWRFCVVGAPSYFTDRKLPSNPQELRDHNCINLRLASSGNNLRWEFRSPEGRDISLRVEGQAIYSTARDAFDAAVDGLGWIDIHGIHIMAAMR